jgi:hypothetical protein
MCNFRRRNLNDFQTAFHPQAAKCQAGGPQQRAAAASVPPKQNAFRLFFSNTATYTTKGAAALVDLAAAVAGT